jgi:hypothetical protein
MKFICAITVLILLIISTSSNGYCQTVRTDSITVPVILIDDCIHYKADAEFYLFTADSLSWVNVELRKEIKEIGNDKYKWFGAGWLGASLLATLFILTR